MPYSDPKDKAAACRRYYRKNADAQRERNRENNRRQRERVLEYYGGQCVCCNENREEFLAVDHIDGGGTQHRKSIKNEPLVRWLIREDFPEGFQVLCHNCNQSMGHYGYCPHQNKRL